MRGEIGLKGRVEGWGGDFMLVHNSVKITVRDGKRKEQPFSSCLKYCKGKL